MVAGVPPVGVETEAWMPAVKVGKVVAGVLPVGVETDAWMLAVEVGIGVEIEAWMPAVGVEICFLPGWRPERADVVGEGGCGVLSPVEVRF